jgi:HEAT repeat protein
VSVCPACGAELRPFSEESFEEKLIRALNHPEPSTPIRAATILGRRRSTAAVEPLIALGLSTSDPYIQEAVAMALGEIGDPRARECLERLRREGALRVRLAAEKAARGLETAPNATGS